MCVQTHAGVKQGMNLVTLYLYFKVSLKDSKQQEWCSYCSFTLQQPILSSEDMVLLSHQIYPEGTKNKQKTVSTGKQLILISVPKEFGSYLFLHVKIWQILPDNLTGKNWGNQFPKHFVYQFK